MYITQILVQVAVVIACITIHEFSHGYVAFLLGDDTAKRAGRLTLNPIKHLDILGAIMLLIAKIGWAKPVPINPNNFKDMKMGTALTAAAGPASNFLFAIIAAILLKMVLSMPSYQYIEGLTEHGSILLTDYGAYTRYVPTSFQILSLFTLYIIIVINIALGLFNLIPFPPLDGSKIISGFMSDEMYFKWMQWERKGGFLLIIIFAISFIFKIPLVGTIILPALYFFVRLLLGG